MPLQERWARIEDREPSGPWSRPLESAATSRSASVGLELYVGATDKPWEQWVLGVVSVGLLVVASLFYLY